jgi:tetratricopeptide (TPR) repeat protein
MLSRFWYWGGVLVVSSALVAGCKSASSSHGEAPTGSDDAAQRKAMAVDWPPQKIAEAHAHYAAAVIHELNDESSAALDEYYQAALGDPDDESLVLEVSRRFLQNKQPDKAREIVSRAAARPNATGPVLARLGLIDLQLGKIDQAISANRMAIKRAPASLSGYQSLFLTYLQNKQGQQALKTLDQAERQTNPDAEFLIGLSELYADFALQVPAQKSNANGKALAALTRAEKLKPDSPALRLKLADGFVLLGATDKAAELYLELLKTLPDVPLIRERVHAKLADIYLRGSDRKHAVEQLQAIIRDDPTNPQAWYWLGSIAFDDKKPAQAAEYFGEAIMLSPEFEQAYYDLASAQMDQDKPSDALATLDKARKKFPQNFVLELLTGMAFSRQKAYNEALQHFTAAEVVAQATDPSRLNYLFYFQIGATCERRGDLDQAETYFQKSLKLKPDFDEALNYLGYMWAEHGMKLDQARDLIQKALKIDPNNGAYLDSLGWVLFKLNQPREALDYMLKAVAASQEPDPTEYDHLGDVYAALNQKDKAREAWRKSLSLEANEAVQKKLDALPLP